MRDVTIVTPRMHRAVAAALAAAGMHIPMHISEPIPTGFDPVFITAPEPDPMHPLLYALATGILGLMGPATDTMTMRGRVSGDWPPHRNRGTVAAGHATRTKGNRGRKRVKLSGARGLA